MKKTIFLAATLMICLTSFCQTNKKAHEKPSAEKTNTGQTAVAPVSAQPQQYFILLSQDEAANLFNFVANADIYSDKGRAIYLDFLKKHTYLVPAQKDSSAKADSTTEKLKPKK